MRAPAGEGSAGIEFWVEKRRFRGFCVGEKFLLGIGEGACDHPPKNLRDFGEGDAREIVEKLEFFGKKEVEELVKKRRIPPKMGSEIGEGAPEGHPPPPPWSPEIWGGVPGPQRKGRGP